MKAHEVMTSHVISIRADATLEAIARLLTEKRVSSLPVVDDDGRVIGIVGEGDLFLKEKGIPFSMVKAPVLFNEWVDANRLPEIYARARHHTARDVMTTEVLCVDVNDDLRTVVRRMLQKELTQVPVLRDGKLAGIIARADLIRLLAAPNASQPAASDENGP